MTKLTLPDEIGRKLTTLGQCVALCDDSSKTIGYFTPAPLDAQLDPQISEQELDRRECKDPTYTSAEVRARLRGI